jgi:hypothetical protein
VAAQKVIDRRGAAQLAAVDAHMKAAAARLKMAPVLKPTDLETAAAAMVPKQTPKVTAEAIRLLAVPGRGRFTKFRGLTQLEPAVNGRHSSARIKKLLEAQAPVKANLQQIIDYVGVLAKAGLVEMPVPAARGQKPVKT